MIILDHPEDFRTGTRVVILHARKKDGAAHSRTITRVTRSVTSHALTIAELAAIAEPGERIYGSADSRDVLKAARLFKHAMIDEDETEFFTHLSTRWASALMQRTARDGKLWLWDCDEAGDEDRVRAVVGSAEVYSYRTVSGSHVLSSTFDLRAVPPEVARLRNDNAMMLWAHSPGQIETSDTPADSA